METETKTLTPTERINRRTVTEIYSALATGDMQGFMERLAPDVTWTVAAGGATGGTYHGPQEVLEKAMAPIAVDWSDFTITLFELTPVGDKLFAQGEYRGVNRTTGKEGAARFVHVWHLLDGIAQRFETVFDTHTIWRATQ
ncbi:nuclear transport factor 2 family protein [Nonomuraea africana]|uniref:Ketosteroid isomerase-like protein n=1 Tax=Nonomuraea africana TaxID=46171 RepID=A0ABR9KQ28_9ACTN|nr:nuclear transport factor 2 family protein [Nonomuraea africana]MBE1563622.1 ketosteroid isomerase-like protein [Nonomuraea africana]